MFSSRIHRRASSPSAATSGPKNQLFPTQVPKVVNSLPVSSESVSSSSSLGHSKSSNNPPAKMRYIGAVYQRNGKRSNDYKKVYDCTGEEVCQNKRKSKPCKGRVSFAAGKVWSEFMEDKKQLIGGRLHSEWCEYYNMNKKLYNTARLHGFQKDSKNKLRKDLDLEQPIRSNGKSSSSPRQDLSPEQSVKSNGKSSSPRSPNTDKLSSSPRNDQRTEKTKDPTSNLSDQLSKEKATSEWKLCQTCNSRCESVSNKGSEAENWYCSKCREVLVELDDGSSVDSQDNDSQDNRMKATPTNLGNLADEKSDEDAQSVLDLFKSVYEGEPENEPGKKIAEQITSDVWKTSLNELECFVDHLVEAPLEQESFRVGLQDCNARIGKILNKSGAGEDRQSDEERMERWQKMDEIVEKSFEWTHAKWKKMDDAFEDFCGSLTAMADQTEKDSKPEVHSPELICILSDLSNLTFREEYERMNASLASACSSSEATAEESINDQPQAMNGEVADLLDCSSVEQQSKMDELLPNEGSLTIDPENSPSCSFEPPAKRMRTQDAQDPAKVEAKQDEPTSVAPAKVAVRNSAEPKVQVSESRLGMRLLMASYYDSDYSDEE